MSTELKTDLYQLTMAAVYFEQGLADRAVFELFIREMPKGRGYLIAAGLEHALEYLEGLRFGSEELAFLRSLPVFSRVSDEFFTFLGGLRFTGDLWAMPEGTPCFAGEPILKVEAPMVEAQLVETYLLSLVNFQTMVATKAARIVTAARGKPVFDFGTRRAHGPEAGVLAARAAYLGGCQGTSNVEAARRFGIPAVGTMAHSMVLAFDSEALAFAAFSQQFPENSILLIDTYDTLEGARIAAKMPCIQGIRLDSGELNPLSLEVRRLLDEAGREGVRIVASGDLNEYRIEALEREGAAIDLYAAGTDLVTSRDAPTLNGVYKLVEQNRDGKPLYRAKFSSGKATWPGGKQIFRRRDGEGDVIALADEAVPDDMAPLLRQVMQKGRRIGTRDSLEAARVHAARELDRLPGQVRLNELPAAHPVKYSARLQKLRTSLPRA